MTWMSCDSPDCLLCHQRQEGFLRLKMQAILKPNYRRLPKKLRAAAMRKIAKMRSKLPITERKRSPRLKLIAT